VEVEIADERALVEGTVDTPYGFDPLRVVERAPSRRARRAREPDAT
jgi:hypothetical protein